MDPTPDVVAPVQQDREPISTTPPAEPPSRVPPELRAVWAELPEKARKPVERMARAFEERYQPIAKYDDMARQQGTTLAAALDNYHGIEEALRKDPAQGLALICQNMGLDFRQIAAHVVGAPHDASAETQQLREENAHLRQVAQQSGDRSRGGLGHERSSEAEKTPA